MATERWRSVVGCAGYECSDLGRVRKVGGGVHGSWLGRRGWLVVSVLSESGQVRHLEVHRAVAAAFLGVGEGEAVGHRSGDRRDNRVGNLVRCESEREARRMSGITRYAPGERNGRAKLSRRKAERIRAAVAKGRLTQGEVAVKFGVSRVLVNRVVNGRAWV